MKHIYNESSAFDASGTVAVTIVTGNAREQRSGTANGSSHGRKELARLGWPLTSKTSIYGRFLARFNFTRANNSRPRRSVIFIRRSTRRMRVRIPPARVYMYVCTTSQVPARSQRGVYISPSLPFRGHKLSERLLPARHAAKERRGRTAAYKPSAATSRVVNSSRKAKTAALPPPFKKRNISKLTLRLCLLLTRCWTSRFYFDIICFVYLVNLILFLPIELGVLNIEYGKAD